MSKEPLLNPEEVASVLSTGDGIDPGPTGADGGPSTYSLRDPVIIPPTELESARRKMETLTAGLQSSLAILLGSEIAVEFEGFQQQKISTALGVIPSPQWVISFRNEKAGGIALVLPSILAMVLMELTLGGVGAAREEGREPTGLERRIMTQFLHTWTPALNAETGLRMSPGQFETGGIPHSFGDPGETVGVTLIRFKVNETEQTGLILANGGFLNDGLQASKATRLHVGPLAPRLEKLPVRIQPLLPGGRILMRDLIAMRQGEVLKLDTSKDAELQIRIRGTRVFTGRIGRNDEGPFFGTTGRMRPADEETTRKQEDGEES